MRAAGAGRFRHVLSFRSRVGEAAATAAAAPATAAALAEDAPETFPPTGQVWPASLYGEHAPSYRRQVLDGFATDYPAGADAGPGGDGADVRAELRVLSRCACWARV
ncbi:hypothetical protein AB0D30_36785 [Streptomyces sp. NPDC048409]|uniref:hypothetical protein n=1 Tax=Streptomyces sp. NPDC048409 TaxID=3154723 RepID=UPI003447C320